MPQPTIHTLLCTGILFLTQVAFPSGFQNGQKGTPNGKQDILQEVDSLVFLGDEAFCNRIDSAVHYYNLAKRRIQGALSDWELNEQAMKNTRKRFVSCKAELHFKVAGVYIELLQYEPALQELETALALYSSIIDEQGITACNISIAGIYFRKDQPKKAEDHLRRIGAYFETEEHREELAYGKYLLLLSDKETSSGQLKSGYYHLKEAEAVFEKLEASYWAGKVALRKAKLFDAANYSREAISSLARATECFTRSPFRFGVLYSTIAYELYILEREEKESHPGVLKKLMHNELIHLHPECRMRLWNGLAAYYLQLEMKDSASVYLEYMDSLDLQDMEPAIRADYYNNKAARALLDNRFDLAGTLAGNAVGVLRSGREHKQLIRSYSIIYEAYTRQGYAARAKNALDNLIKAHRAHYDPAKTVLIFQAEKEYQEHRLQVVESGKQAINLKYRKAQKKHNRITMLFLVLLVVFVGGTVFLILWYNRWLKDRKGDAEEKQFHEKEKDDLQAREQAAREEKDRMQKKLDVITRIVPDIVATVDAEGEFTEAYIPDKVRFVYHQEELLGKSYYQIFPGEAAHSFKNAMEKIKGGATLEVFHCEIRSARKKRHYEIRLTRSRVNEFMVIIRDVSERLVYEQKLRDAKEKAEESDRLKSAFLSNISHEIRTPMNAIVGFSHLLDDAELDAAERDSYLKLITQNTHQLVTILSDIMELSKMESGILQINESEVNINIKLQNVEEWLCREKLIGSKEELSVRVHKPLPDIRAVVLTDPDRLEQVIRHLLDNAVKFTEEGTIEIGYNVISDNYLEFYVKDTGIGIPPGELVTIFDRFKQVDSSHTRQYEGAGLGLALSKKIIGLLGGEIYVKSRENTGSEFYFTIPYIGVSKTRPERFTGEEEVADYQGEIGRIRDSMVPRFDATEFLVVDDDKHSLSYFANLLHPTGARVHTATTGEEALSIIGSENIQMVLLDIRMPGIDGLLLLNKLRTIDPGLKVIAQTAYGHEYTEEELLEAGFNAYISKPFRSDVLLDKLKTLLNVSGYSGGIE